MIGYRVWVRSHGDKAGLVTAMQTRTRPATLTVRIRTATRIQVLQVPATDCKVCMGEHTVFQFRLRRDVIPALVEGMTHGCGDGGWATYNQGEYVVVKLLEGEGDDREYMLLFQRTGYTCTVPLEAIRTICEPDSRVVIPQTPNGAP